jgi:hypothetical protein
VVEEDPSANVKSEPPRPTFALDFPRNPELDALVAAFEAGNFAEVKAGAGRLASSSVDDVVKRAAETLVARTRPDPLAKLLLLLTAVLLVVLAAFWITHDGPRAPP